LLSEEAPAPGRVDEPGDLIAGKYRLEHVLGEGGMGVVWRARNLALDLPVAIKLMGSVQVGRTGLRERLLLEAKAAATLAHPAIVRVFDVDQTEGGKPFLVMELLSGTSLGTILRTEGRMSAARAVSMLLPIAEALWLAHEHGIVHRDVKPDNILIVECDRSIQPKLMDFGIVKIRREGVSNITEAGQVVGSPTYLSPEQARGQDEVDHQIDVWSFSVSLYELISGRPPFDGANFNALLRQILEDSPASLHELELVDDELSSIVARGLSKRPEERGTIGEMGQALAAWLWKQGIARDICGTALVGRWLRGADDLRDAEIAAPPDTRALEARGVRPLGAWLALVGVLVLGIGFLALRSPPTKAPSPAPVISETSLPSSEHDRMRKTEYQDVVLAPSPDIETLESASGSNAAKQPQKSSPPGSTRERPSTRYPSSPRRKPKELINPY
jgi:eukaryotic-like serine/threonine-protein kinase